MEIQVAHGCHFVNRFRRLQPISSLESEISTANAGWFRYQTVERLRRRMSLVSAPTLFPRPVTSFASFYFLFPAHAGAFKPHYRRFETRHVDPMSFFIALLVATGSRRRFDKKSSRLCILCFLFLFSGTLSLTWSVGIKLAKRGS